MLMKKWMMIFATFFGLSFQSEPKKHHFILLNLVNNTKFKKRVINWKKNDLFHHHYYTNIHRRHTRSKYLHEIVLILFVFWVVTTCMSHKNVHIITSGTLFYTVTLSSFVLQPVRLQRKKKINNKNPFIIIFSYTCGLHT